VSTWLIAGLTAYALLALTAVAACMGGTRPRRQKNGSKGGGS